MTVSMRERMARAMFETSDTSAIGHTWESISEQHMLNYLEEADAALDALMEPTDGMIATGANAVAETIGAWIDPADRKIIAPVVFAAMISAAREGK